MKALLERLDRPTVIGIILILALVILTFLLVFFKVPDSDVFKMLVGGLLTMAVTVTQFDFGSSSGSKDKDVARDKALNSAVVGLSNNQAPANGGVAANPAAKAVMALFAILFLFSFAAPAFADPKKPLAITGHPLEDLQTDIAQGGGALPTPQQVAGTVSKFLVDLAAISDAVNLSTEIPGIQDPVGNACWKQFQPIEALIKAHPLPLSFKVAADIEALRLTAIAMNQVCANPNCGQMFLDATNAANAISKAPIPISMASICSMIPVIGTSAAPTLSGVVQSTPAPAASAPAAPAAAKPQ